MLVSTDMNIPVIMTSPVTDTMMAKVRVLGSMDSMAPGSMNRVMSLISRPICWFPPTSVSSKANR